MGIRKLRKTLKELNKLDHELPVLTRSSGLPCARSSEYYYRTGYLDYVELPKEIEIQKRKDEIKKEYLASDKKTAKTLEAILKRTNKSPLSIITGRIPIKTRRQLDYLLDMREGVLSRTAGKYGNRYEDLSMFIASNYTLFELAGGVDSFSTLTTSETLFLGGLSLLSSAMTTGILGYYKRKFLGRKEVEAEYIEGTHIPKRGAGGDYV